MTTIEIQAAYDAVPEPKRRYALWLRDEIRRLHAIQPFSDEVLTSLGVDPVCFGVFAGSQARTGECEWLIAHHGKASPESPAPRRDGGTAAAVPAPVATSAALKSLGTLGEAISAAITDAVASLPPSIDESAVRAIVESATPNAAAIDARIQKALTSLPPEAKRAHTAAVAAAISMDAESPFNLRMLSRYAAPGAARKPVKFAGEPGASKTWAVRKFGQQLFAGSVFDLSCHMGTTQREMLGGYVPYGAGFEKVYGTVTKAFLAAAAGTPTLLVVDEITRLLPELMSVFCGSLNRQTRSGVESYVLNTGIPDGKGGTEEVVAPCHMLSIAATCNEGAGFNVSAEDSAELQRWIHIRVAFDATEALKIAGTVLFDRWGVTDTASAALADKLVKFLVGGRILALTHSRLKVAPTIRAVVDAINIASSAKEADIAEALWLLAKGWYCGLNPLTNSVEREHVDSLKACFQESKLPVPKGE